MVGLVFADTLHLTWTQGVALGLNAAGWLWCFRWSRRWLLTAVLTCGCLWSAFFDRAVCTDHAVLFRQARYVSQFRWDAFVLEFPERPYVGLQPPFLTFWFSRAPVLWQHQLLWLPFAVLCAGCLWKLYGRRAALLLATPVWALMIHQPSSDVLLLGMLLVVLRLLQLQCKGWAAVVYGLTWPIKPLTLLTAPLLLPRLGVWGLGSLAMWGGYLLWSQQWPFGREHLEFLQHQLMLSARASRNMGPVVTPVPGSWLTRRWATLCWRWQHLGRHALPAAAFYLFPAWTGPVTWQAAGLGAVIVLGYGNIKYLLLMLLWCFPMQEDDSW